MVESKEEKSLDSEIHESVWQFMKLITTRLGEGRITSVFRRENLNPTGDLVSRMLINHKLRTSFDFEKALSREVGIKINRGVWVNRKEDTGVTATWSPRILDAVAGEGTTASAIFELKESGWFRGAKRRLRFGNDISNSEGRTAKHQKMTGMEELINNLSISSNGLPRTKDRK